MSVRVVARIRPLLKQELDRDTIVTAEGDSADRPTVVRIPNPKNDSETFSFQFNGVYDSEATQQQLFEQEVAPTVKHLFGGFDVTIFAYGVTGTGKTHTMRGGKSLVDRGVIPRLLSSIYRRSRKIEKDTAGATHVEVAMSYYEIYNDRVYDLFEPLEKRTPAGLPIRDNGGKTVVVGLTERPCTTLKEFENLYDQANVNRSTSATKLNAHSSRSHAILCVKLTQTTADMVRVSTASAIDLAGSEDNRRTDNNRDRLVESASINKSLFVLAQCVEAISRKQARIPYRESKMTRILSLGQNDGLTLMVLNLAPVRAFHLDTLSSLNFANRTKKIEVAEVENEPLYRAAAKPTHTSSIAAGSAHIHRQPLRPISAAHNAANLHHHYDHPPSAAAPPTKPAKAFTVYTDARRPTTNKRSLPDAYTAPSSRPTKAIRPSTSSLHRTAAGTEPPLTAAAIESLIDARVSAALAAKSSLPPPPPTPVPAPAPVSAPQAVDPEVQARLDRLEARIRAAEQKDREIAASTAVAKPTPGGDTGAETSREGLRVLVAAKRAAAAGQSAEALALYRSARRWWSGDGRLERKIAALEARAAGPAAETNERERAEGGETGRRPNSEKKKKKKKKEKKERTKRRDGDEDEDENEDDGDDGEYDAAAASATEDDGADDDSFVYRPRPRRTPAAGAATKPRRKVAVFRDLAAPAAGPGGGDAGAAGKEEEGADGAAPTPRTAHILAAINSRSPGRIRALRGVGAKKALAILGALEELGGGREAEEGGMRLGRLEEVAALRGVGRRGVEAMRGGCAV